MFLPIRAIKYKIKRGTPQSRTYKSLDQGEDQEKYMLENYTGYDVLDTENGIILERVRR